MASILPKQKPGKPLQIQFKEPNQKCTITSLTNTLKRLIPNLKEIKITSKKLSKDINKEKLHFKQALRPLNVKMREKTQVKPNTKDKLDEEEVEYYPDKLKRKVDFKKIVLEPRHDYKVVAATNKRKRSTPVKEAGSFKKLKIDITSPEIVTKELSFEDMIPSSIIHKIKDLKTNLDFKNAQKTANIDQTTDKDLKNNLKTCPDQKNASSPAPDPKNDSITPSDSQNMPLKENWRKKSNLKKKVLKSNSGPQMEVMEHFMNDESLTDEDFMEILTCPSPVWWEDPPDPNYIEEPIGRFLNQDNPPKAQDCTKVPSKTTQPIGITQNCHPELTEATTNNKQLIEKRLKLEKLLSSLKNTSVGKNDTKNNHDRERKISSDGSEFSVDEEDLVKSLQSIEIPIKNDNIDNMEKKNETVCDKDDIKADSDVLNEVDKRSAAKTKANESNNNENEIKMDKNKSINDVTATKDAIDKNDNPKNDTESSIDNKTEKKKASPRKSNRISPKKHHLTNYYNLKSKRPKIIKQNPRNKVIIENHAKTNNNSQKTPEKKLNRKTNDVSKIKKAYLDLLKHSKVQNNLTPKPENKEVNTRTTEMDTQETANITEKTITIKTDTEQSTKTIETEENNKSESLSNDNSKENNDKNTKSNNEIPLTLPKLTKIPQNLAWQSPKSIKSVTSDSTDANSEMDTISDTNVQFIDEYDEKKDELVTVYQIISKNEK